MRFSFIDSNIRIKETLLKYHTALSLHRWNKNKEGFPVNIELNPVDQCNQTCLYCNAYYQYKENKGSGVLLAPDDLFKIVDSALEMGMKFWYITGNGEPMLMREAISSIVSMIKNKSWNIGYMATNLTLFNRSEVEDFVLAGWDIMDVKLNSSSAQVHDEVVGMKGAFGQVIKNLELFRDLKKKLKSKLPEINLGIFLHNRNYTDFHDIVELGIGLGAARIDIYPFFVHHEEVQKLVLSSTQERELRGMIKIALKHKKMPKHNFGDFLNGRQSFSVDVRKARKIYGESDINLCPPDYFNMGVCLKPWTNISIFSDKRYGPCCMKKFDDKITNGDLKKAWFGKYFNDFRRRMIEEGPLNTCQECLYCLRGQNKRLIQAYNRLGRVFLSSSDSFLGKSLDLE